MKMRIVFLGLLTALLIVGVFTFIESDNLISCKKSWINLDKSITGGIGEAVFVIENKSTEDYIVEYGRVSCKCVKLFLPERVPAKSFAELKATIAVNEDQIELKTVDIGLKFRGSDDLMKLHLSARALPKVKISESPLFLQINGNPIEYKKSFFITGVSSKQCDGLIKSFKSHPLFGVDFQETSSYEFSGSNDRFHLISANLKISKVLLGDFGSTEMKIPVKWRRGALRPFEFSDYKISHNDLLNEQELSVVYRDEVGGELKTVDATSSLIRVVDVVAVSGFHVIKLKVNNVPSIKSCKLVVNKSDAPQVMNFFIASE
jgi:hypothetical protein